MDPRAERTVSRITGLALLLVIDCGGVTSSPSGPSADAGWDGRAAATGGTVTATGGAAPDGGTNGIGAGGTTAAGGAIGSGGRVENTGGMGTGGIGVAGAGGACVGETDTGCGGPSCPKCAPGQRCVQGLNCTSGVCTNNICVAPSCSDGVKNGNETDVDCGGECGSCGGCTCRVGADCLSSICRNCICIAATCTDGVRNGSETDVDCGGASCPACALGMHCLAPSDCRSGSCTGQRCD